MGAAALIMGTVAPITRTVAPIMSHGRALITRTGDETIRDTCRRGEIDSQAGTRRSTAWDRESA
jgi:hypothetical protein